MCVPSVNFVRGLIAVIVIVVIVKVPAVQVHGIFSDVITLSALLMGGVASSPALGGGQSN